METMSIAGLTLFFATEERDAAELVGKACERSIQLIHELWGLDTPQDFRVYVMTSWLHFVFHAAPWPQKLLMGALFPLWAFQAKRMWPYVGGWARQFGERQTVGVKPPRLLQTGDRSFGERIFVPEENVEEKLQHVTCHELTHAFSSYLRLPMWLHEGLAMVTVDGFLEKPTVKADSIAMLSQPGHEAGPGRYRQVSPKDPENLVYHTVRGYWLTRYLLDTQTELLKGLLVRPQSHEELENKVAAAYGQGYDEFWTEIDQILMFHFENEPEMVR